MTQAPVNKPVKRTHDWKPTPSEPVSTTYQDMHVPEAPKPVRAPQAPAPKQPHRKFEGVSENRAQFTAKEAQREVIKRKEHRIQSGKFEGQSEFQRAFPGHEAPAPVPRAKAPYQPSNLPFEGVTTAGEAFKGDMAPAPESFKPKSKFQSQ